jgi:hypothetical protein
MWEFLTLVSLLFLVGGFLILRDKGITFRSWLLISVLAVLFMMTAAYGAQLLTDMYYPSVDFYVGSFYEERALIEGLTLLFVGIIGLIFLTIFTKNENEELGIAFGMGGSILVIVGLIDLLRYEEAFAKLIVSMVGVIIISFLIYRYRDFLLGEK